MMYIYIYIFIATNGDLKLTKLELLLFALESAIRAHDSKDFFGQQRCVVGKHGRLHVKALIPQDVAIMTQHLSKSERYASAHSSVYSLSQATWFKYQFVSRQLQTAIGSVSKISQNLTQKNSTEPPVGPSLGTSTWMKPHQTNASTTSSTGHLRTPWNLRCVIGRCRCCLMGWESRDRFCQLLKHAEAINI